MADRVIIQVMVDSATWRKADQTARSERTTLGNKIREYVHALAKTADDPKPHPTDDGGSAVASEPRRRTGIRCYDHYAHRVIDTSEIGLPQVVEALPLENHWIEIRFDDGRHGVFDMNPHLDSPIFRPLRNTETFNRLHVDHGTVCWPDGIDIASERLWTDCEPVIEHWTDPKDYPVVGHIGPDGSAIVDIGADGRPITEKLLDKWADDAERGDYGIEPEAPIFIRDPSSDKTSGR